MIFDLDGTLVDSVPGIDAAVEIARGEVAPHLAPRTVRDHVGPPLARMLAQAFPEASTVDVEAMSRRFRPAYDEETIYLTTAYDGVQETLEALVGSGVTCFVATNKPRRGRDIILRHLGLQSLFADFVSPDDQSPPHPRKADGVGSLLQRHDLRAATTAFVGDGEDDRLAARAHGLAFLVATWGYGRLDTDPLDAGRLRSMRELLDAWTPPRARDHHA